MYKKIYIFLECRHTWQGLGHWISNLRPFQPIHRPCIGTIDYCSKSLFHFLTSWAFPKVMAYSYTMMALEVWNKQEFGQVSPTLKNLLLMQKSNMMNWYQIISNNKLRNILLTKVGDLEEDMMVWNKTGQVHSKLLVERKKHMLKAKQKVSYSHLCRQYQNHQTHHLFQLVKMLIIDGETEGIMAIFVTVIKI